MAASGTMNNFTFGNASYQYYEPSAVVLVLVPISMVQMRFKLT